VKHCILSGLILGAACFTSVNAHAQKVITPPAFADLQPYIITSFSISSQDTTIAFSASTSEPGSDPAEQNIWTTSRLGGGGAKLTDFSGGVTRTRGPSVNNAALNATNFVGFIESQVVIPAGAQSPPDQLGIAGATASLPLSVLTPPNLHVDSFSWSLDPSQLVIEARDENEPGFGQDLSPDNLYIVTLPGVVHKLIACPTISRCVGPQWSANENVIAYTEVGGLGGSPHIVLINPDGSGKHTILTAATNPVWSPNANRLAFSCGDDICTSEGDGSNRRNVTNGAGGLIYSSPSWPADESLIAMQASQPQSGSGVSDIFVVSPDGAGAPIALTNSHNAQSPQWDQSINQIFYICTNPGLGGTSNDDLCVIDNIGIPQGGVCDPTTCSGCCLEGICFPGDTSLACGVHGAACSACPGKQVCSSLGICVNPPQCDIANCTNGCCDAQNQCQSGKVGSACGTGGQPCSKCNNGEICDVDQRICETQLCSAANCTGCCGADGKCNAGTTNSACGGNGFACTACTGTSKCNANRICENQGCDAATCPGCCDANGVCQMSSSSHCGYNGFTCVTCGSGQTCDINSKTCTSPQSCTSANCNGCCGADNACHSGNTPTSCGFSGFSCSDCTPGKCLSGACQ
jgi:hypothetical protein